MQRQAASEHDEHAIPFCVDLDGTLVQTDTLVESVFALLASNFLYVFVLPFWLIRGKAYLKDRIADQVDLDVAVLPYHKPFLEYLKAERASGRQLVLATAANYKVARKVADYLGLFEVVLASDRARNLSGTCKADELRTRFGDRGFDYAGNARVDLSVWARARQAVLVNPEFGMEKTVPHMAQVGLIFKDRKNHIKEYLLALRVHQWTKNLLVFVPLFAAHQITNLQLLSQALLGFLAFCVCASSVYLLNDLLDLPSDRHHPRKRYRPFAAGTVPMVHGVLLIPSLLAVAVAVGSLLPQRFLGVLAGYYILTLAYSLWLKKKIIVDVLVLAGLYTSRIMAGSAATGIIPSFWLLAFSMFLFLSLAFAKRFTELLVVRDEGRSALKRRAYKTIDLEALMSLGGASGYLAVLVLALYINGDMVRDLYAKPELIWLLCPLLLYWVSRVWLLARRGALDDDPVVFALRDHISRWIGVIAAMVLLLAV